ncbi:hypothetical protein [Geodermatophilus sp. SYSU D01036]
MKTLPRILAGLAVPALPLAVAHPALAAPPAPDGGAQVVEQSFCMEDHEDVPGLYCYEVRAVFTTTTTPSGNLVHVENELLNESLTRDGQVIWASEDDRLQSVTVARNSSTTQVTHYFRRAEVTTLGQTCDLTVRWHLTGGAWRVNDTTLDCD